MVCLMALSNAHGWLMLNTGNKSEAAMGYSTLYGDTAGAFAPLGGVYKTDVFAHGPLAQPPGCGRGRYWPHSRERVREAAERGTRARSGGREVPRASITPRWIEFSSPMWKRGRMRRLSSPRAGLSRDLVDYVIARTDANAFKRALEPPYPDAPFYGDPASR